MGGPAEGGGQHSLEVWQKLEHLTAQNGIWFSVLMGLSLLTLSPQSSPSFPGRFSASDLHSRSDTGDILSYWPAILLTLVREVVCSDWL